MSVWGKILGGAAGLMIGGPIGALLGAAAGHAYDALAESGAVDEAAGTAGGATRRPWWLDAAARELPEHERPSATRQIAFTIGVIALGAKLAKVDGVVSRREVAAFRSFFEVPPEEVDNVGRFFDLAKRDARGFEPYARQLAGLFPDHPAVLEDVLTGLFLIALADGGEALDDARLAYLRAVAAIFGLDETRFRRVASIAGARLGDDPYALLEVDPGATDEEVKAAHRRLARRHHPDRMVALGMPSEAVALANRRLAAINAAHDRVRAERAAARAAAGTPA